jgi:hypothetical protein|tara:strand:+ start:176 stop:847 length:672 start_codon:yes stop_codon:yes gene_type:complete
MASKIKVDQIEGSTGSSITIPSGQTLTIADGLASSTITSGTLADARIPDLNASKITAGTIATARLGSGTASSSTFLRGDGTFAAAGGGKINQVLQVITNSQLDLNSSSSFVDFTGMSLAITPSASNSKILIMADVQFDLTTGDRGFQIQILRDSTVVFAGGNNKSTYTGSARIACRNAYFELDEPASTSSLTYKIQVQTDSSGSSRFNQGGSRSSIVLMEVLA